MKKIFLISTLFLFITNSVHSQDFYFGISSGMVKSVYFKTDDKKHFQDLIDASRPSANLIFSTIFKNNLELATGVMFYPYPYKIRASGDEMWGERILQTTYRNTAYFAFSVPVHLGYKFKLAPRLYANIYSGLNFDFYFSELTKRKGSYGWGIGSNVSYATSIASIKNRFNLMFSNRVSLQYFTKFNMGIGIYAAYHSGLLNVWDSYEDFGYYHTDISGTYGEEKMFQSTLKSDGSFWNFGLELGYKLERNKEKKSNYRGVQDFYFGISSGILTSIYYGSRFATIASACPTFTFSTIFKNNLELETGIMYYQYLFYNIDNYFVPLFDRKSKDVLKPAYHAFSLPVHLGYKIKLANRFFLNAYTGLKFDFYFNPQSKSNSKAYEDRDVYITTENALKQRFNILLSNKLSMQYFTKFNMGISLFASYHSGLFQVWESSILTTRNYSNGNTSYHRGFWASRGSYWILGLELGYKLEKNRAKKTKGAVD
ncbi:MAG: hypothetical protein FWD09_05845 [Lentimicrobiaceae bacterium]|nr:hypothetical protein [Lentimicrobiaceae bacterium]